jgi:hypothetical protein
MARLTAIEISSDTCVLVKTSVSGTSVEVGGVQVIDPAAYPGGGTFAATIRQGRRAGRFPRRARVVLWGMPEGAKPDDPSVSPQLEPLIGAGFRIDRAVTPCNALAALARVKRPKTDNPVIWIAIDRGGVALIAMRTGELLYSHAFDWDSSVGAIGSQAHLLQRYSLVSFLAPQIRRAMTIVQEKGGRVDGIVTCGTLNELRSLTMPLTEELDIEVETLDSTDGLTARGITDDRLAEMAVAVRIACAGAIARPTRTGAPVVDVTRQSSALRIAALALLGLLVAIVAWLVVSRLMAPKPEPPHVSVGVAPPERSPAPVATPARPDAAPPAEPPSPTPTAGRVVQPRPQTPVIPPKAPAGRGDTPPLLSRARRADTARADPLKDPLPIVNTILVSPTRRFATIDGQIVAIGDKVGQRLIVGIEPHFVVFREPSGAQIRVGLGGRRVVEDRVTR